ncbi:reverse transcriptase domain-containing protein [Tanacetum coccineum]|uniref:Reverse transcriptase domain-containing protein n=1 Tax=Tanacetum coccineum TaxID=301880 RepID=A0ABQ4ZB04_9ASTR
MRTRSSSNLIVKSSTILKRRNRRRSKQIVKLELRTIVETPVDTMADTPADGNLLNCTPLDALTIIENKLKVRTSRNKPVVSKVSDTTSSSTPAYLAKITALTDAVKAMLLQNNTPSPTPVKAIEETCVTCGGPHPYYECLAINGNTFNASTATQTYNQVGDLKAITTRSGVSYDGPTIPPTSSPLLKEVEREPEATKDKVQTTSTTHVQPLVVQVPIPEPNFLQIFQKLYFDISFADALLHIPKFASTFKSLLSNKEKLFELANTSLNENCSAVLLKKFPEKLGEPRRFLIPCDFHGLKSCKALADLGASINLMPLSVWKKLSLPDRTPTLMTLELATRTVAYLAGIAEDVCVQVGKFTFPADFVVVDYDVDSCVPFILGRPFLRTAHALVDVHEEELILRDGDEKLIFHADSISKHPHTHGNESINMISFIEITCEDRFPKVLKLKKSNHPSSGSTTPLSDSLPSLTPFETRGDILLLEKLLNDDPSSPLPSKELHFEELKMIKYSINDSPPLNVLKVNSVTFSNPLFDANDDFTSSNDESLPEEDVPEENFKIYSNPLFEFDDKYISSGINPLFNEVLEDIKNKDYYVSNLDEPALLVTPLSGTNEDEYFDPGGNIDEIDADVSIDIKDDYHDLERDIIYLRSLFINDIIPNLPPEVFLDHDPKSLTDEPKIDNLKIKENVRFTFEDCQYLSLTFVIKIFLPFLTYPVNSLFFSPSRVRTSFLTPASSLIVSIP